MINGTREPQSNREEVRFGQQGGEYSKTIQGPKEEVRALIGSLVAAGASGVYICDQSPIATLEYSFGSIDLASGNPANETPQYVYECIPVEVEKDLMDVDIPIVNDVNGTASEKLLREALNGTVLTDAQVASLSANAATLYGDIKAGVRSIRVQVPTLKVSKIVSNTYTIKASQANVGRILSTSKVSTDENIPVTILFDLPTGTTSKPNRGYGWMKKAPNITVTGGNRFAVSQEYEFGLWSTIMYGALVT